MQCWLTRRFTNTGLVVLGCLLLTVLLGGDTNHSLTYQIFPFLLSLLVLAIAVSLSVRYGFNARRMLPRFGTVGVPLTYRVAVQLNSQRSQTGFRLLEEFADPRPRLAEVRESPEPLVPMGFAIGRLLGLNRWFWLLDRKQGARVKPVEVALLHPNRTTDVVLELIPRCRGVLRFRGLTLARPDPLGLFQAFRTISLPQSLLILPRLYQLPPIALPGTRRYQSGGIALASSVGDTEEFRSLREYRPGDSPRKIHWKSWAKTGKAIVKEEQDEFFVRHALILDTFQSQAYSEIFEAAIAVAASFACEIQTQESLLDLMFVGLETYCFTIGRGLSHTDRMLEILASVTACRDKPFDDLIGAVINRSTLLSGCIGVFLSWDDSRQQLVRQLQAMRLPTLVLVITENPEQKPATMHDSLTSVLHLRWNQIQEGLMQL